MKEKTCMHEGAQGLGNDSPINKVRARSNMASSLLARPQERLLPGPPEMEWCRHLDSWKKEKSSCVRFVEL